MGCSVVATAATHVLGAKKLSLDPSTDTVSAGYYSTTTLANVDTDFAEGNIRVGFSIFGKLGAHPTGSTLPDTGQTVSYTGTFGEDHDYQPVGSQASYTIYNPIGVSSVTVDNLTGLMWVTNPVDAGINSTYTWENAIIVCENLNYAGYDDWRLPNVKELLSIVDYGTAASVKINSSYFLNTNSTWNWTSTTCAFNSNQGWCVPFSSGEANINTKTIGFYIRCVRGGAVME